MRYVSTRGEAPPLGFMDVTLAGLARDGGLYVPERFPRLMGKLAFPSLIVQAIAPSAGALLIEAAGTDIAIAALTALAIVNLALIGALWALSRKPPD